MGRKVLISLVSEQTIPNVILIKEKQEIHRYLFISTEKMEKKKKVEAIIKGASIEHFKIDTIVVKEDNLYDIEEKLKQSDLKDDEEFIINLTGGTKLMSIGIYNFFKERKSEIIYIPIGKNIYKIIVPKTKNNKKDIEYRLSLKEYLSSNGVEFKIGDIYKDKNFTDNFFDLYTKENIINNITKIREFRNGKKIKRKLQKKKVLTKKEIPENIFTFLKKLNLGTDTGVSIKDFEYIIGGWFEEYIYNLLVSQNIIKDNDIGLNIEIFRENSQNEFDVIFTYDNALFVIECKTGLNGLNGKIVNETLYKLDSLKKDFGLFVKAYLITLEDLRDKNGEIKKSWEKRAALMNITIIDRKYILEKSILKKILK